jgi:hypothetical protein
MMLAEIFMVRLEMAMRALEMPRRLEDSVSSGDHRFVPFRPDAGDRFLTKSQRSGRSE